MIPVILESPFSGDTAENIKYLQRCIKDCLERDEAPFASHQMYTMALKDELNEERVLGIQAGYEWMRRAEYVVFYINKGMSPGMHQALDVALASKIPVEFRRLREE